jgi:ornithine cyclodeaminase/alanine dehydrogenase-like protein (mu-crystallin family)
MDAAEITAKRTAICSALATKALADPDSKILGLIGAGVQAGSHIWALRHLFNFSEVNCM